MRKIICLAVAAVVLSVSPVLASSMQSIRKDSGQCAFQA